MQRSPQSYCHQRCECVNEMAREGYIQDVFTNELNNCYQSLDNCNIDECPVLNDLKDLPSCQTPDFIPYIAALCDHAIKCNNLQIERQECIDQMSSQFQPESEHLCLTSSYKELVSSCIEETDCNVQPGTDEEATEYMYYCLEQHTGLGDECKWIFFVH